MAELEVSLGVTQNLRALQDNPKHSLRAHHEALHRTNGKTGGSRSRKRTKGRAVETKKAFVGTDPQKAVRGLRERGHGACVKAPIAKPALAKILRDGSIWITRVSRAGEADNGEQEHPLSDGPLHASITGDTGTFQLRRHFRFAEDFCETRLRKTAIGIFPDPGSALAT